MIVANGAPVRVVIVDDNVEAARRMLRRATPFETPPSSTYVSLSRLRVAEDAVDELVAAFRGRAHLVDEVDGFLDLEVWSSDRESGELIMVSRWRDRACFRAYMKSDAHGISHARIPHALRGAIALERLEHLHTYDVVAR